MCEWIGRVDMSRPRKREQQHDEPTELAEYIQLADEEGMCEWFDCLMD